MAEPLASQWSGVKPWLYTAAYTSGTGVVFNGSIYTAVANVGPVAQSATPAATPGAWTFVTKFVGDALTQSDTLALARQRSNSAGFAITNLHDRAALTEADIRNLLTNALTGYTGASAGLQNRFLALEADIVNILTGVTIGTAHSPPINGLETRLTGLATNITSNASATTALAARVTTAEGTIATQGTAIVGLDTRASALESGVSAINGFGYTKFRGAWTTGVAYRTGDIVSFGNDKNLWSAASGHTAAADFATDLGASRWVSFVSFTGIGKRYEVKTASFTAEHGGSYFINSLAGNVTITLPASPVDAAVNVTQFPINITHIDGDVTVSGQKLIVGRNGKRIMGQDEDLEVDKPLSSFSLVYCNATYGWRVTIL